MADDDSIEDQASNVAKVTDAVSQMGGVAEKILPTLRTMYDSLKNIFGQTGQQAMKDALGDLTDISAMFQQIEDQTVAISDDQTVLFDALGKTNQPVVQLLDSFTKLDAFVSNAKIFDKIGAQGTSTFNALSDNVSSLKQGLESLGVNGINLDKYGRILENASQAEKLESAYVSLTAKAGELDNIFGADGKTLKDLATITSNYSERVSQAAVVTGLGTKNSFEFAAALKQIPGAFKESINSGSDFNESNDALIASMRLASGTTGELADVQKSLKTAYDDLGQSSGRVNDTGKKGMELLALTSQVANTLKINFSDVDEVMGSIAKQFQFIGNETDAAGRTLARYTDALRETGLTGKASLEVIQNMITGIKDMNVGTKAFLSLRSGGPGGLQGSFQIDQLLRQGKLDQVVGMAETSLKQQFGGRIYTQAEAAQSPEAAAKFMQQRQLLQSGAFGVGKNLNDDQATRFLEALGQGKTGNATEIIKSGQAALVSATEKGASIQERNNSEVKKANVYAERGAIAAEITAGIMLRNAFGAGTKGGQDRMIEEMQKDVKAVDLVTSRAHGAGFGTGGPEERQKEIDTMAVTSAKGLASTTRGAIQGGIASLGAAQDEGGKLLQSAASLVKNTNTARTGPAIHGPEDQRKQGVLARATAVPMPTHPIPAHVGQPVHAAPGAAGTAGGGSEPIKIKLEIVHPDGMTVKKSQSANSVHAHNQASSSTTINFP